MKKLLLFIALFAILLLPQVVKAQSDNDQQLGLQFYNQREYQKAAEVFERLYSKKPDQFSYTYYLQSLLELNNIKEAERLVKQQIKRFPSDAKYLVDQGYIYIRDNQATKALKLFEDLIKNLEPDQRTVIELANAFTLRREYELAIKTYQKGRQMLAPDFHFGFELANMYEMLGQYDNMVKEYLSIIAIDPMNSLQVQNRLQHSLSNDPENLKTEALRKGLIMQVQKNPDDIATTEMLVWLSLQLKDFESALIQAKALDRRLSEDGQRVFALGQMSVGNGDYKTATDAFTYVMERTSDPSLRIIAEVELLKSEYELLSSAWPVDENKMNRLAEKYRVSIKAGEGNALTWPLIRNLAHIEAFYLNNTATAIELLEDLVSRTASNPQLQAQSKLELADILLFSGEPWEATLLYSQVDKAFKNDPLGHEARFRNARLSFYIGEFDWARAQLDVLKAATSKLIANDAMQMSLLITDNIDYDSSTLAIESYARADLSLFRNKPEMAYAVLDSVIAAFPGHPVQDDALMKQAEIRMKQGNFVAAESLLKKVIDEYPDDILADDAMFDLANLYNNQLNDSTKAMEYYNQLMTNYPGSLFVVEARKQYRTLRGDFQGEGEMPAVLPEGMNMPMN
jgi:tetratricopeptide (TPR) repeat protein